MVSYRINKIVDIHLIIVVGSFVGRDFGSLTPLKSINAPNSIGKTTLQGCGNRTRLGKTLARSFWNYPILMS